MAMQWTAAQQAAIEAPRPSGLSSQTLLVAAAAGSGKTAVLVERIVSRLRDSSSGLSVDELLVMTFTNAAAAEMRARIGVKLAEAYEDSADDMLREYLQQQQNLLPSAHISTFDAFCQWLVRNYYYYLELEPDLRVSSDGETLLMSEDVLDALLLEAYENNLCSIYELAEIFGDNGSDRKLKDLILKIYTFSLAQDNPSRWLDEIAQTYEVSATKSLSHNVWGKVLWQYQVEKVALLHKQCAEMEICLAELGEHKTWQKRLVLIRTVVDSLAAATTWDEMHRVVQGLTGDCYSNSYKPAAKDCDRSLEARCIQLGLQMADSLAEMTKGAFIFNEEEWQKLLHEQAPLVIGLVDLVRRFSERFLAYKLQEKVLDFSDYQHFSLALLTESIDPQGERVPSQLALELQKRFKEVMVDEYQDTNGVQEAIVKLISRKDNRFFVGDVKQSIYGFRLADPTLFMEKYASFSSAIDAVERRIDLSQNFRSHEAVLAGTNFIFRQLMVPFKTNIAPEEEKEDLTYADAEALYPGRVMDDVPDNWLGGTVTLHIVDGEEEEGAEEEDVTSQEKEIQYIIQEIKRIKDSGATIQDKDGAYRPAMYRDMVVLLRSTAGIADVMVTMFRQAGIPAYTEEKTGYFSAIEVQSMLALLTVIDNPEQDLPLATVLRSPLVGMNVDNIGRLRASGEGTLWSLLPAFAQMQQDERALRFVAQMEDWRTLSRRIGVGELIWRIYEDTGYLNYVSAMPNGTVRRANLAALYDRAKEYESSRFRGLFRFLRFIESIREAGKDLGIAKTVAESDDVVRIMTIHHSKGLEFPIVFLGNMTKRFNEMDLREDLIIHKKRGIGLKGYYPDLRVSYYSLPWLAVRLQKKEETLAEEQRLLYVAMTRAKDKLYLSGSCKDFAKLAKKASGVLRDGIALSKHSIMSAKSFMDWVLMALSRHKEAGAVIRSYAEMADENYDLPKEQGSSWTIEVEPMPQTTTVTKQMVDQSHLIHHVAALQPVGVGELAEKIKAHLTYNYGHEGAVVTPAKISVSEVKRRFMEREEMAETYRSYLERHTVCAATEKESEDNRSEANMIVHDEFSGVPSFLEEKRGLSATEKGTALHLLMQLLDLPVYTEDTIAKAIERLTLAGHFSEEERAGFDVPKVADFYRSDLGRRLLAATRVEREFSFSILLPAQRFYDGVDTEEKIFMQGVIDAAFLEKDEWVLLDYKTDRASDEYILKERYRIQLHLYKDALEQITGKRVKEMYLYSMHLGKSILID